MKIILGRKILLTGLIALGIFLVSTNCGWAENKPNKATSVEETVQRLKQKLSLSDDQAEKVRQIFSKPLMDPKQLSTQNREELGKELKAKMQQRDAEMAAILTPEQQKQFQQMKSQRQERREGRRGGDNEGRMKFSAKQSGMKVNPKTGQIFPPTFKYDPATGDELKSNDK